MGRLSLLLLALSLTPALAADAQKPCPAPTSSSTSSTDEKNWTWKDGAGQTRTRADLDGILRRHQQWLAKYQVEDLAQPLSTEASNDPGRANLKGADLTKVDLESCDLSFMDLDGADLTKADLESAVLTKASLKGADLSSANLSQARLKGATLDNATLINAVLSQATLNGAILIAADLTSANLSQADLSGTELRDADLSDAELTLARFWFADFAPEGTLLVATLSPGEGLETIHWSGLGINDEEKYRALIESARNAGCSTRMHRPPLTFRWRVWLARERQKLTGFEIREASAADCRDFRKQISQASLPPDPGDASTLRGEFQVIDLRTALKSSGHSAVELEVNLAYQRQTQSWWRMIVYDWTCGYGTDPVRPLIFALILAVLAIPIYGFGFRQRWFGSRIRRIEMEGDRQKETFPGDPETRPQWRETLSSDSTAKWSRLQRLLKWLGMRRPAEWLHSFLAPHWPRLCWEIGYLKSVVIFSLISVVNLSFASFDVGHWARLLFFSEYDLKARGWLRMVSGLQSLIGLGLLALSLLSFFGHRFE